MENDVTSSFKLGNLSVSVSFSTTGILTWHNGKDQITVSVNDIYGVQADDNTWTVHYVGTKIPGKWLPATTTFSADDPQTCIAWNSKIREAINNTDQDRPSRLLVLINPKSGGGKAIKEYDEIAKPLLAVAGITDDVIVTEDGGHPERILAEYDLTTIDGVIAAGGDGTFMLVSTALLKRLMKDADKDINDTSQDLVHSPIRLGLLPSGTGQGLVKSYTGTPFDTWKIEYHASILQLILGYTMTGKVLTVHNNDKLVSYSSLMCSYGLFSQSLKKCEERRHLGGFRYLIGLFGQVASFSQPHHLTLKMLVKQDESDTEEWVVKSDTFKMADGFAGALRKSSTNNCGYEMMYDVDNISVTTMSSSSSRWDFMKTIYRIITFTDPMREEGDLGYSRYNAKEYTLELPPIPEGSTQTHIINVDGDNFDVEPGLLKVKLHKDIFKIYGTGMQSSD